MAETSLPVEHLFTMTASTEISKTIGGAMRGGPQGTRIVVAVTGGTFTGPKMKGIVKGPGGDWVTMRDDGSVQLDVRLILETDDGAKILMQYKGIGLEGAKKIRTAPLFETGDERYAWLNNVQAIGIGQSGDGSVTYDIYALQ